MDTTTVIFRVDDESTVFALFPELPADNLGYYCTSFVHVGGHGSGDYQHCIAHSRPAKPDEYRDLFVELERRGYHLNVQQRATSVMHERRHWLAAQWSKAS
ncbi:MAG: hypothetical protein GX575_31695 [Candidatus Anammoximicrobium sp.]|mgnify:CR=1 FL=1|nr:hypothetical protein [Candidatus Anammoximicrobium sp.]